MLCMYLDIRSAVSIWDTGMTLKKNPLVFLDVSIDGNPAEKIVIEVLPEPGIYSCSIWLFKNPSLRLLFCFKSTVIC